MFSLFKNTLFWYIWMCLWGKIKTQRSLYIYVKVIFYYLHKTEMHNTFIVSSNYWNIVILFLKIAQTCIVLKIWREKTPVVILSWVLCKSTAVPFYFMGFLEKFDAYTERFHAYNFDGLEGEPRELCSLCLSTDEPQPCVFWSIDFCAGRAVLPLMLVGRSQVFCMLWRKAWGRRGPTLLGPFL